MSDLADQYSTASKDGNLTQLKSLMKDNPDCVYHKSCWMYESAAENGHLNIIKHLLSIDLNAGKIHIAMTAAAKGHLNIIEYLVQDQKIDINASDKPILRYAGINNQRHIMEYLIIQGADIKIFDEKPQYKEARILCADILKEMKIEQNTLFKVRQALRPLQPVRRRPKTPKF